jgi:hypothetical protein
MFLPIYGHAFPLFSASQFTGDYTREMGTAAQT